MNEPAQKILMTGYDGVTALGDTVHSSVIAYQAGALPYQEYPLMDCLPMDEGWDENLPMFVAPIPLLPITLDKIERFSELFVLGLNRFFQSHTFRREDLKKLGIFVALPEHDQTVPKQFFDDRWLKKVLLRMGLASVPVAKVSNTGHCAPAILLADIFTALESAQLDFCVLVGLDTYLTGTRLRYLDNAWRLKSERNVNGFIPGEACVAALFERASSANEGGHGLAVSYPGFGDELQSILSKKDSSGRGLTQALASAGLARSGAVDFYSDFNGESYRAFEWGIAQTRSPALHTLSDTVFPADGFGDVGAASGVLLMSLVAEKMRATKDTLNTALLSLSSDSGKRAAFYVEKSD